MMKWVLAAISLILCSTGNTQSLSVVQSATIHDLYGNTIIQRMLVNEDDHMIDVLNVREFTHDRSTYSRDVLTKVVKAWVEKRKPGLVVFLGEPALAIGFPTKYSSVLFGGWTFNMVAATALGTYNAKFNPIYIITDSSAIAALRLVELQVQLGSTTSDVFSVDTVLDFRNVLQKLQGEPKGTIVLNVFSLVDEWNANVGYSEIEKLLVTANSRHLDVGICRTGFKTTFALGPTPGEAAILAMAAYDQPSKPHISSCANLKRVKAKWLPVYRASIGKFDIVEGGG